MQIKVSRNQIFEQMPPAVRRAMLGENIPEMLTLEVESFEVGQFPDEGKIREKWPEIYETFTNIEWYMFCTMIIHGTEVPYAVLGATAKGTGANPANIVNVHIKNIRRKLRELGCPLEVHTIRGGKGRAGGCILRRI